MICIQEARESIETIGTKASDAHVAVICFCGFPGDVYADELVLDPYGELPSVEAAVEAISACDGPRLVIH